MKTILIFCKSRKDFDFWIKKYGFKMSNVTLAMVQNTAEAFGYEKEDTYFTIIGEGLDNETLQALKGRYSHIPHYRLEDAVKNRKRVLIK